MATWTKYDGRWFLIGAPEFVIAWEGHDGRYHWSVGTPKSSVTTTIGAPGSTMQSGFLYGGLEAAQARAIEVMTERYHEAVAALRKF